MDLDMAWLAWYGTYGGGVRRRQMGFWLKVSFFFSIPIPPTPGCVVSFYSWFCDSCDFLGRTDGGPQLHGCLRLMPRPYPSFHPCTFTSCHVWPRTEPEPGRSTHRATQPLARSPFRSVIECPDTCVPAGHRVLYVPRHAHQSSWC